MELNKKLLNRKIWLFMTIVIISIFAIGILITTAHADLGDLLGKWNQDESSKEAKVFLDKMDGYLRVYDGNFIRSGLIQLGWLLVKALYFLASTAQNLVPQALSLSHFLEDKQFSAVSTAINALFVTVIIITFVILGYKWILGKTKVDFHSIAINTIISISLLLAMPTIIDFGLHGFNGIGFLQASYDDGISVAGKNNSLTWNLIKNNVADLVYLNSHGELDDINSVSKKNDFSEKDFYKLDMSQVLTKEMIEKMEDDNKDAKYLGYQLVLDSSNKWVASKFEDGLLSTFSDSLKTGYYRFQGNIWSLLISLLALAIAFVLSIFVIISAILELAFKRILGVLVFATDLESGQRSKMVLSDILQCYLTVGFQAFGLGMFVMFMNYLNTLNDLNIVIRMIAYISAVAVLIKGSGTIMRYFGVDIGLKEGYGQFASAWGIGAMMMRKGTNLSNRAKNMGGKNDGQSNGEDSDRKPEKNFGESLANKAQSTGKKVGYARERGISGLASDGISMATDRATKPFKNMRNVARNGMDSFKEGVVDGAVSASLAKSRKGNTASGSQGNDRVVSSSERMRAMEQQNQSAATKVGVAGVVAGTAGATAMSAVQQKVQQDIEQRKNAMHNASRLASEEIINQRRNEAKYTPKSREEMVRQRTQGLSNADTNNREVSVKQNLQGATGSQSRTVDVRENLQGATGNQSRTVDVRENLQGATGNQSRTVDVRENLQGATGSQSRTVDVRENLQGATGSQSRTVDVRENLQGATGSQSRTVDVRENLQGATGSQSRTVDVRENLQGATGSQPKERIVNVVENVRDSKSGTNKETVVVDKEVRETKRKRFTYEDNDLFRDRSNDPNPLFDR